MRHILPLFILLAIVAVFSASFLKKAEASTVAVMFTAVADSYVDSANPAKNYGTSTQVRIDGSPLVRSYLTFNVTGISGTISKANLKIYANSSQSKGFEVRRVVDTSWGETTLTYNTAPAIDGAIIGSSGPLTSGTWYTVDVTSAVNASGKSGFALITTSSTAASLGSKESVNAPQLEITYESGATPTPPPSATPVETATPSASITPTPIPTPIPTPSPTPIAGESVVVVAASDVICNSLSTTSSSCQQMAASEVSVNENPDGVLIVGDLCHTPTANCYNNYYGTSWGRLFNKSYPVTGNHDYQVTGASLYFDYWNGVGNASGRAGERSKGYYSFDLGTWHIIALNSQCSQAGGCNAGSAQYTWLQADLATHPNKCTLAFYHIPVFSSGGRANNNMMQIFNLLYNNNVDIVLNGHDHIYERFAPQNPSAQADPARGIREFIVGTAGANHTSIASVKPNSEIRNIDTFGALKLILYPESYDWRFLPVAGKTFTDSGTTSCH